MELYVLVNRIFTNQTKKIIDCITLDPLCSTCSNADFCSSCSGGKFGYQSNCLDYCPGNTYNDGVICVGKNSFKIKYKRH